jgi:AcrR family transcriptional regulator
MSPRITPENRIPDIVSAAISVFSRKGYRLTQMEEIANEANVSKATLYYYFKSKLHLFQYVLQNSPQKNEHTPPPASSSPKTERDFLQLLRRELKEGTRLRSIDGFLKRKTEEIDLEQELAEIIEEIWDINEKNRVQIVILEKSFFEFPELAETYDKYGRRQLLHQIEKYLSGRINAGIIRSLGTVAGASRFMLESLAWFGFKQYTSAQPMFTKAEVLPDLIHIFVHGLKR